MNNVKRIEKKLPQLLCETPSSKTGGNSEYRRIDRNIEKFKRHNPTRHQSILTRIVLAIQEYDNALTEETRKEIELFNKRA